MIIASCFLVALVVTWRKTGDGRPVRPTWSVIRPQLAMGRDLVLRSFSFQVAFVSAAAVAGRMGDASLAAHQIMLQLWNFLTLVLDSVAIAAQALVGAALGKASAATAWQVGRKGAALLGRAGVVLAGLLAAGAVVIPGLFTSGCGGARHDPRTVAGAGGDGGARRGGLRPGRGAARGGDVAFLRNAAIVSVVLGFIPGVWLSLVFDLGLTGLWCGLLAFIVLRLLAVTWRYRSGGWVTLSDASAP